MTSGLLHAYLLDGKGGGRLITWDEVQSWSASMGRLWLHFDYTDASVQNWLHHESGLDELVAEALLTEETRPRATSINDGLLILIVIIIQIALFKWKKWL